MPKAPCFSEVRRSLLRRGFLPLYADRAALEISDHWHDLVDEATRQGLEPAVAEQHATERLGDATALAAELARRMQQTSWLGRFPTLSFALLPIILIVVWWAVILCAAAALAGYYFCTNKTPAGPPPNLEFMQSGAEWARVVGFIALPMFVCHLAARFFCGWRAALWGCLILAAHNALHIFKLDASSVLWGYRFGATGLDPGIAAIPLFIFGLYWFWNSRKENYALKSN